VGVDQWRSVISAAFLLAFMGRDLSGIVGDPLGSVKDWQEQIWPRIGT